MKKLGIHLSDAKGEFVGMGELIRQFQDNMKGMTREQISNSGYNSWH